jgi:DNA-binding NarL/FixJ family response regulator
MKVKDDSTSDRVKRKLKLTVPRRRSPDVGLEQTVTLLSSTDGQGSAGPDASERVDGVPVILIEDNRLLLDGLTTLLSAQGLKVVASARNGTDALRQVARLRPHLVLVDATLGDHDCVHLVEAVKRVFPAMKIIVMHLLPTHSDLVAFVRAGVSGFIMKDANIADIVSTIRAVADGESVLPAPVTSTLFSHIADEANGKDKRAMKAAMRMTARERKISSLVADGLTNPEIAKQLRISTRAVRSNVQNILEKMALHTRLDGDETPGEVELRERPAPLVLS